MDSDIPSVESWYYNLRRGYMRSVGSRPAWDIRGLAPGEFFREVGTEDAMADIDVICGGPPCQAYSRIGKAKLKSLSGKSADVDDHRGSLFHELLRYVSDLNPLAVLMENVPGSCNYGGACIPEDICDALAEMGYDVAWTLLDASEYGVPQFRQRVIIQAIHGSTGITPSFPLPSHRIPPATLARSVSGRAEGMFNRTLEGEYRHFVRPACAEPIAPAVLTVGDALSDLPRITPLALVRGASISQDVNVLQPYNTNPRNAYQQHMRTWAGFGTSGWVTGNTIRNTARDFATFALMAEGDQYPKAHALASHRAEAALREEERRIGRTLSTAEASVIRRSIVPPYSVDKFDSKWTKLNQDRPSHTVVAHLQFDTYSHIHYDSTQARAISVREAARLQSFPDGFRFMGSMGDAFRQIGNAVPPLLARSLGTALLRTLRSGYASVTEHSAA